MRHKLLVIFISILLPFETMQQQQQQQEVNNDVKDSYCNLGAAYYCQTLDRVKQCNKFDECMNKWNKTLTTTRTIPTSNDTEATFMCKFCNIMMDDTIAMMQSPNTEKTIQFLLQSACNKIPNDRIKKSCLVIIGVYLDEMMKMLASDIDKVTTCRVIKMCQRPAYIPPMKYWMTWKPNRDNNNNQKFDINDTNVLKTQCHDCLKFINDIKIKIGSNSSIEHAKQSTEQMLCKRLPQLLHKPCQYTVTIVIQHGFTYIANLVHSNATCAALGFCTKNGTEPDTLKSIKFLNTMVKTNIKEIIDEKPYCNKCSNNVQNLKNAVKANDMNMNEKIIKNKICHEIVKTNKKEQCQQLIKEYHDEITSMMKSTISPKLWCHFLHANNSHITTCSSHNNNMYNRKQPSNQLIKNKLFSLWPLYNNVKNVISKVAHCTDAACEMCETITGHISHYLPYPHIRTDKLKMIQYLKKICHFITPHQRNEQCEKFVSHYGIKMADLFAGMIMPKMVCSTLGVCPKFITCPLWQNHLVTKTLLKKPKSLHATHHFFLRIIIRRRIIPLKTFKILNVNHMGSHVKFNQHKSSVSCSTCKYTATVGRKLIRTITRISGKLPEKMRLYNDLYHFCQHTILGLKETCISMITRENMKFIDLLLKQDGKSNVEICNELNNCKNGNILDDHTNNCKWCKKITLALQTFPKSLAINSIQKRTICSYFPVDQFNHCNTFLNKFGSNMIDNIEKNNIKYINYQALCAQMKVCTEDTDSALPKCGMKWTNENLKTRVKLCNQCQLTISRLANYFSQNRSAHDVKQYYKYIEDSLNYKHLDSLSNTLGKCQSQVMASILQEYFPLQICVDMNYCIYRIHNNKNQLTNVTSKINKTLALINQCKDGAKYWCQFTANAQQCGFKAIKYCSQHDWHL